MSPLEGVRVLAIEQYGAGPWGSLHLAELGAEVIKIEDPASGGDIGRYVPPYADGDGSLFFEALNRNKLSVSLDLRNADGRRVFEDLVCRSDVVYSNMRGDVPAKLRIRYEDLCHLKPAIVCCSLSGFGMTGPRRAQPGYDYMLQALAGWMDLTGDPGGPPTKSGVSLVDFSGGLVATAAILAGLHAARRDGVGMDCDVSLYDTAVSMLNYLAAWHLNAGHTPARTRHSAHPSIVPFQALECADAWIVVACAKDKFWQRLVDCLGTPAWADDPRFATMAGRRTHAETLLGHLEAEFRSRPAAVWIAALEESGVPCAPVQTVGQALADSHTAARGLLVETDHPRYGTVRQVASPIRVGEPRRSHTRAPRRDEHGAAILRDLVGYDGHTMARLATAGAFGPAGVEAPTDPALP